MLPWHNLWDLEEQIGRDFFKFYHTKERGKATNKVYGAFTGRQKRTTQGVRH